MRRCISLSMIACLVFTLSSYTQTSADEYFSNIEIVLNPVDVSLPTINDTGDGVSGLGEQAWFAFDLSAVPEGAQIVSATFSAFMWNMSLVPSQRYLWYYSDDSWIFNPDASLSDPGDYVVADEIVGTLWHDDSPSMGYTWKTIQMTYDGWAGDIADGYISLMLTGGQSGSVGTAVDYSWGVVKAPELILTTTWVPQAITVTSPNGGESWQGGTEQTITWNSDVTAGANVKIELYQNCVYLRDIVASTANDGSYTWQIPSDLSSRMTYKVKIIDTGDSSTCDYTDGYFHFFSPPSHDIYPPEVETLSPTNVADASATLKGQIISDGYAEGDEACMWRFSLWKYGDQGHVITTDWECCANEGETFSSYIEGLEPNTVYRVMAEASNSAGADQGDAETFTTLPEVVDPNNISPAEFDPNEINTLLIQNFVKQFQTDPNAPHAHQGLLTYVEKAGNLDGIDTNDMPYIGTNTRSSIVVSLIAIRNSKGEITGFKNLSKDARPGDAQDCLFELSIYSPLPNDPNVNSENCLKFWLAEKAFKGKSVTIQIVSSDPNITYPVWDVNEIIIRNDRKLPLDNLVNQKPNIPYAWLTLSTSRQILDMNGDGIVDLDDYALLTADVGKTGIYRSDIACLQGTESVTGIPDGKVNETDVIAFITEYNKKHPANPIPNPYTALSEDFESGHIREPFITSGDSPWNVSYDSYKGAYSAESGEIGNNKSSVLEANVDFRTGRISFWRKVSSEPLYDNLIFYIDDVEVQRWSGILNWEEADFQTTPGTHNIKWIYEKDTSLSLGYDAAFIDEIIIY